MVKLLDKFMAPKGVQIAIAQRARFRRWRLAVSSPPPIVAVERSWAF